MAVMLTIFFISLFIFFSDILELPASAAQRAIVSGT